jgi:hypothetical protein
MLNLIDIIENKFIKEVYPNGIEKVFFESISTNLINNSDEVFKCGKLVFIIKDKPNVSIEKFGKFNKDFNAVRLTLNVFITYFNFVRFYDIVEFGEIVVENNKSNLYAYSLENGYSIKQKIKSYEIILGTNEKLTLSKFEAIKDF